MTRQHLIINFRSEDTIIQAISEEVWAALLEEFGSWETIRDWALRGMK
jgi:hypothetical protein